MIVVDTDVLSYFWMDLPRTPAAREARRRDGEWIVPFLWHSEFRSVLRQHIVANRLSYADAVRLAEQVEKDMANNAYKVSTASVLRLVDATGHSSYDCEYIALAQEKEVILVTGDRKIVDIFPETAVLLEAFVS